MPAASRRQAVASSGSPHASPTRLLAPTAEMHFAADRFMPTAHSPADAKARFANRYVRFVAVGFDRALFQPWFYRRLSMTFGHIAHYNLDGFYATWFERTADRHDFVAQALRWRGAGDPAWTYCDVETALQQWLASVGVLDVLAARVAAKREAADLAELRRLLGQYGLPPELRRRRLLIAGSGGGGPCGPRPPQAPPAP